MCMYTLIHVCVHVHTPTYICICTCTRTDTSMCTCISMCICIWICIRNCRAITMCWICGYAFNNMYVCVYNIRARMYAYTHIHICVHGCTFRCMQVHAYMVFTHTYIHISVCAFTHTYVHRYI